MADHSSKVCTFINLLYFLTGLPIFTKVPPSLATPVQFSTFRVVCQAEGFPPPMLKWTRSGMSLPVGKTEVKDGTLTITDLSLADNGLYVCEATNSMGTKKTRINLGVQRAPGLSYFILFFFFRHGKSFSKHWPKTFSKFIDCRPAQSIPYVTKIILLSYFLFV